MIRYLIIFLFPFLAIGQSGVFADFQEQSSYQQANTGGTPTDVSVQILASNNDAEQNVSTTITAAGSSDLEMSYDGVAQLIGLRFPSHNIPADAPINTATIQFTADAGTAQSGTPNLTIKAQKSADPPVFVDVANNISNRTLTTASVTWNPTGWTSGESGTDQETPDLSSLIQEVVNDASYSSTDAFVFVISGSNNDFVRAEAYDASPTKGATLNVNYDQ